MRLFTKFIHSKIIELMGQVDIDKLLVLNGYSYLDTLIQRNNKLFGGNISEQRKIILISEEAAQEQNNLLTEIRSECRNSTVNGGNGSKSEALFTKILSDERIFQHVKSMVLHRYFSGLYEELIAPYESDLEDAKLREYELVCRCFGSEQNESLGSLDKIGKRRSVYNEVIEDVFTPYGFIKRTTMKGFVIIHKILSDDLTIVFSSDTVNLTKYYKIMGQLSIDNYIGASKKSNKTSYYSFQYPRMCFAYDLYRRYQDIQSMEVAIRANGFFYEAIELKLEESIKEYLNSNVVRL